MRTVITNEIRIENPTKAIMDWCDFNLTFTNPEYTQFMRMGKEDLIKYKRVPEKIKLYYKDGNVLGVPYGCLNALLPWIKQDSEKIYCHYNNNPLISFKDAKVSGIDEFYDYQEDAINAAIAAKGGVIVANCGAGKSFCGMEIIKRIGRRALWLCHTGDLLRQAKDDLLQIYPTAKIGLTTEGKLEIGEDVTISTVQTMCNIDPELYRDKFDVVICDEAAHVCGSPTKLKMFTSVLSKIPARYKFGLTATPTRADGLINAMYAYLGVAPNGAFAPTYKVDRSRVKTMEAEHIRVDVQNNYLAGNMWKIYDSSGMLDYNKLINELCADDKRNAFITENIVNLAKQGRKQIVLSLRVEHCEKLVEMLQQRGVKALLCVGKITAKKREQILKQQVEWDVIVATYSLLKEGVSIKELDTLHFCSPAKEKGLIVQCAGRIERYLEGKKQPQIYDYVDIDIPYCENAYKKRKSALKRRF
jgi:superfamily II DNA or RNA helicase